MNISNKSSGFCTSLQMFITADESTVVIFSFICCFILNIALPKINDPSQLQSVWPLLVYK